MPELATSGKFGNDALSHKFIRLCIMNHLKKLVFIFCTVLALSGCSYFEKGDEGGPATGYPQIPSERIDLMTNHEAVGYTAVPLEPAEAIARHTDGRVQIFSLDEQASLKTQDASGADMLASKNEILPVRAVPPPGQFLPRDVEGAAPVFSGDPSVQIFSLDGEIAGVAVSGGENLLPMQPERQAGVSAPNIAIIYFGHDSDELSAEAMATIERLTNAFSSFQEGEGYSVEGHASVTANYADEAQRRIVNLKISMDRALAVSRALINGGIPADSIRVVAWGDAHPPRDLDGMTLEEASRRVEIFSRKR